MPLVGPEGLATAGPGIRSFQLRIQVYVISLLLDVQSLDLTVVDLHRHLHRTAADLAIHGKLRTALAYIQRQRKGFTAVRTGKRERVVHCHFESGSRCRNVKFEAGMLAATAYTGGPDIQISVRASRLDEPLHITAHPVCPPSSRPCGTRRKDARLPLRSLPLASNSPFLPGVWCQVIRN